MNYGQLKTELASLGFSDLAEINDFGQIVPDSLNRAITEINQTVCPIIGTYEIVQDGSDDGILYYEMPLLTKDGGIEKFLGFHKTPVMKESGGKGMYRKFSEYEIENDTTLVIDGNNEGTFNVYYKKAHTPFTLESLDTDEIELPLKAHALVPLLTAYYVWLEDEKAKAVDYYNQYEKLSQMIFEEKPRLTILSGGI